MNTPVRTGRAGRPFCVMALALVAAASVAAWTPVPAGAASPEVTVTPGPGGQPYRDGATVSIRVGPNSTFSPNSRIEVLECGAPRGVVPTSDAACDGNTVQLGSVLVGSDGSFTVPSYTLYSLPNTTLGEAADNLPVCNATSECVLYVGQDQNDFTEPKTFSAPFAIEPTSSSTPTTIVRHAPAVAASTPTSAATATGSAGGTGASPAVDSSDTATHTAGSSSGTVDKDGGVLAFTGVAVLPWLFGIGTALVLAGAALTRRRRRAGP